MLSPVYDRSLGRIDEPLQFSSFPLSMDDGDAGRGRWLVGGQLDISSRRVPVDVASWWIGTQYEGTLFFETLHGFEFAKDLKALGGHEARQTARILTQRWFEHFNGYNPVVWQPALTARRLVHWMVVHGFAYDTAPDDFILNLHNIFYRQYNHLDHVLSHPGDMDYYDRATILWALILGQCHCDTLYDDMHIDSYLLLMKGILGDIINTEGGIMDRKPNNALEFLSMLLMLKQSLQHRQKQTPLWLSSSIDKITNFINSLTHSDKDFPLFQGGTIPHKKLIEKTIRNSGRKIRRLDQDMVQSGYSCLRKGRTSLLIDHGLSKGPHIAPMAIEIGYGNFRIITSCGTCVDDKEWAQALSNVAAHSTLDINGFAPKPCDDKVKTSIEKMNGDALFVGAHDGYRQDCNVTHTRRIYMDKSGEDIRGEDIFIRDLAVKTLPIMVRFHLHAATRASLIDNGDGILIKLPNGVGWKFHHDGKGTLDLQDSVMCSNGFKIEKTMQIIVL